ncbi:MAG: ATP-binding protein [Ignavibacteria bacterium]|nr:ATP-binding protein [Ignavibacteria bacterium]
MKLKESETIEFKKSVAELNDAVRSISAILNKHQKGELFFGLKNDGLPVKNLISEKTLRDISQTITDKIEPRIYPIIVTSKIKNIEVIKVGFEGTQIPYSAGGKYFIRVADEDKQMTAAELKRLILNNNKLHWDSGIHKAAVLKDIDTRKVKDFCRLAEISYTNLTDVLDSINLIHNKKLTNAAVILFAKNPYRFFFNAKMICAVFASNNTAVILDQKEFAGDLFSLIKEAELYILKNIHIGMEVHGLYRKDIPEINQEALREAIVNAFIHRDYYDPDFVSVGIFENRVEIRNPGGLYGGLKIQDIIKRHISKRRNELIADVFSRAHFVERKGRGISLILTREPSTTFEEIGELFITTFERKTSLVKRGLGDRLGDKLGYRLSDIQKKIIDLIIESPQISITQLHQKIGVSTTAIENNLKKLKNINIIERVGKAKTGFWKVKAD